MIAIQEVWRSERPERDLPTTTNPISDRFYLYYPPHQGTRVCLFINRSIPIRCLRITDYGGNLVAVAITNQGKAQQHTITIFNIYNPNPLPPYDRLDGLPRGCMLPKLNNALRRINGPNHSTVVVGDFNLHYSK